MSSDDVCDALPATAMEDKKEKRSAVSNPYLLRRGIFLLLGDSITQMSFSPTLSGWGSYVADVYQRRVDVLNRGFSGYNTEWFLKYADTEEGKQDLMFGNTSEAEQQRVKLITIFFGANDSSDKELNTRHHVPLDVFQSNLRTIVERCRQSFGSKVRILFITPPPIHHPSRLVYQIERYGKDMATGKLERTLEVSGKYAAAVESVAKDLNLPCINVWKEMQDAKPNKEEWSVYLSDGLHLSQEGNLFVGRRVIEMIQEFYPEIAVTPCPFTKHTGNWGNSGSLGGEALGGTGGVAPWHDGIDYLNPDLAFEKRKKQKVED